MDETGSRNLISVYTGGSKQDAVIKKELLESEGIPCRMEIKTEDATASAWGMPMGMEHLVHTFELLVERTQKEQAETLISSSFVEEILYLMLFDREHNLIISSEGLPRDAIDSAADPKHFTFLGDWSTEEAGDRSIFQVFLSKRHKEKIALSGSGYNWKPLHAVLGDPETYPHFRSAYITIFLDGFDPPAEVFSAWSFGASPADADSLGKLVAEGAKRATTGLLASYEAEGEALPGAGDVSVILNGAGRPVAVIRTGEIIILPFQDVTAEMAAEEGEGDLSLAYWRKGHRKFFKRECRGMGIQFFEELDVVFERFELLKLL